MFKRSLDDQRRLKQEASDQQPQLPSNAGNQGYHVPGLTASLPDSADVSARINRIPGLDQPQVGSSGYAPRYECSPPPQQEKQPYMSAVSMESTAHISCSFSKYIAAACCRPIQEKYPNKICNGMHRLRSLYPADQYFDGRNAPFRVVPCVCLLPTCLSEDRPRRRGERA